MYSLNQMSSKIESTTPVIQSYHKGARTTHLKKHKTIMVTNWNTCQYKNIRNKGLLLNCFLCGVIRGEYKKRPSQ